VSAARIGILTQDAGRASITASMHVCFSGIGGAAAGEGGHAPLKRGPKVRAIAQHIGALPDRACCASYSRPERGSGACGFVRSKVL
jgi:hypothetical protein